MSQAMIDWKTPDVAARRDPRPLADQLAAIAELGAIAPEALMLAEIRMLCAAYLARRPDDAERRDESGQRLSA